MKADRRACKESEAQLEGHQRRRAKQRTEPSRARIVTNMSCVMHRLRIYLIHGAELLRKVAFEGAIVFERVT